MFEPDDDPRLTDEHVRTVTTNDRMVTIVGVVHDHPASIYRVIKTITRRDPEVVALELPPLAIPLFREYARDSRTPPALGGEMSAAIQAANANQIIGIDGPSRSFLSLLSRTLAQERASVWTVRGVSEALLVASKSALVSRILGTMAAITRVRIEVGDPWTYTVDWTDDPETQAADERAHLGRARALSASLVPPAAKRIRDEVREDHMIHRLSRTEGDVVAIVGQDHLDAVADGLAGP